MIYTKYFSLAIKSKGALHLNSDQLQRMMNIVYLESSIETMEGLGIKSSPLFLKVNSNTSRLKKITKELKPEALLSEMLALSQRN